MGNSALRVNSLGTACSPQSSLQARGGGVADPLYKLLPALRAHGRSALYDGAARIDKRVGVLGRLRNGQLRERLTVTLPIFGGLLGRNYFDPSNLLGRNYLTGAK